MFYGTVQAAYIEGIIELLKSGDNALQNKIQQQITIFFKKLHVDKRNGQIVRFTNRFAIAYAAGVIGIKLGILPYKKNDIFKAISLCYQSALSVRPMSYTEKVDFHYNQIISILTSKNKFLDIRTNKDYSHTDVNNKHFIISSFNNKKVIGVHSKYIKKLLIDSEIRKSVLEKLRENGMLIVDASGKNTLQLRYKQKTLKRRYCFSYSNCQTN